MKIKELGVLICVCLCAFFFHRDVLAFQEEVTKKEEEYRQEQHEIVKEWAVEVLPKCFGGIRDVCILPAVVPAPREIFIDIMKENGYDASIDVRGFGRLPTRLVIKKIERNEDEQ